MAIEGLYKCFSHWGNKGGVWCISDTHFNENDLKQAFPNRPDDETLLKQINQKVGKAGVLIHLGDVGDLDYAKRLKGYKILIMGNHDQSATKFEGVFDEIYQGPIQIAPHLILSHEPLNCSWAYNMHGHNHSGAFYEYGKMNVCADVIGYSPINFNQFIKSGKLKECQDIHRQIINDATKKARKRGHKLGE